MILPCCDNTTCAATPLSYSTMKTKTQRCPQVSREVTPKASCRLRLKLQLPDVGRLAGHDQVFALGYRFSFAMIRLPSKAALFKFLSAREHVKFGDDELVIRPNETNRLRLGSATENFGGYPIASRASDTMTLTSTGKIAVRARDQAGTIIRVL